MGRNAMSRRNRTLPAPPRPARVSPEQPARPSPGRKWVIAAAGLLGLAVVVTGLLVLQRRFTPRYWTAEEFGPTQVNSSGPPGSAPEGMVWVPGGTFWMGDEKFPDAQPVHKVYVD